MITLAAAVSWLLGWIITDRRLAMISSWAGEFDVSISALTAAAAIFLTALVAGAATPYVLGRLLWYAHLRFGRHVTVVIALCVLQAVLVENSPFPLIYGVSYAGCVAGLASYYVALSKELRPGMRRMTRLIGSIIAATSIGLFAAVASQFRSDERSFEQDLLQERSAFAVPFRLGPPIDMVDVTQLDIGSRCGALISNVEGVLTVAVRSPEGAWQRFRVQVSSFDDEVVRPCQPD